MAGKWIQGAAERMKRKGTEGSFTEWAARRGKKPLAAARDVMAHKEKYSPAIVAKANFAKNANS